MSNRRPSRGVSPRRRQEKLLQYIVDHVAEYGYPPSIREAQAALDYYSTGTVLFDLRALEADGAISRVPTHPRALRVNRRFLQAKAPEVTM